MIPARDESFQEQNTNDQEIVAEIKPFQDSPSGVSSDYQICRSYTLRSLEATAQ